MKKKIKDLTLEECNSICKKNKCDSNCPFYSIRLGKCTSLISLLRTSIEYEVEVEHKEPTPLEAIRYLKKEMCINKEEYIALCNIVETALINKSNLDNSLEILNIKTREDLYLMIKTLEIIRKYFFLENFQSFIAINGMLPNEYKEECDTLIKGFETWHKKQH